MIYLFLFLAAIAIALLKLGALSVWFAVLSGALIALTVIVIAAVVVTAIFAIWKRFRTRTTYFIALRKP